jgi:hypothetical protein
METSGEQSAWVASQGTKILKRQCPSTFTKNLLYRGLLRREEMPGLPLEECSLGL